MSSKTLAKVDMSPEAIAARLRETGRLWRVEMDRQHAERLAGGEGPELDPNGVCDEPIIRANLKGSCD